MQNYIKQSLMKTSDRQIISHCEVMDRDIYWNMYDQKEREPVISRCSSELLESKNIWICEQRPEKGKNNTTSE